jgi:hypothetical protein
MAKETERKPNPDEAAGKQTKTESTASVGEEIRTGSVTAGTNGGTSNRQDYAPQASRIAPDEPGGTEGRGGER